MRLRVPFAICTWRLIVLVAPLLFALSVTATSDELMGMARDGRVVGSCKLSECTCRGWVVFWYKDGRKWGESGSYKSAADAQRFEIEFNERLFPGDPLFAHPVGPLCEISSPQRQLEIGRELLHKFKSLRDFANVIQRELGGQASPKGPGKALAQYLRLVEKAQVDAAQLDTMLRSAVDPARLSAAIEHFASELDETQALQNRVAANRGSAAQSSWDTVSAVTKRATRSDGGKWSAVSSAGKPGVGPASPEIGTVLPSDSVSVVTHGDPSNGGSVNIVFNKQTYPVWLYPSCARCITLPQLFPSDNVEICDTVTRDATGFWIPPLTKCLFYNSVASFDIKRIVAAGASLSWDEIAQRREELAEFSRSESDNNSVRETSSDASGVQPSSTADQDTGSLGPQPTFTPVVNWPEQSNPINRPQIADRHWDGKLMFAVTPVEPNSPDLNFTVFNPNSQFAYYEFQLVGCVNVSEVSFRNLCAPNWFRTGLGLGSGASYPYAFNSADGKNPPRFLHWSYACCWSTIPDKWPR